MQRQVAGEQIVAELHDLVPRFPGEFSHVLVSSLTLRVTIGAAAIVTRSVSEGMLRRQNFCLSVSGSGRSVR